LYCIASNSIDNMNSEYTAPIVQGTLVPEDDRYGKTSYSHSANQFSDEGGYHQPVRQHEQQPNQFRDVIWAVAFVAHLVAMLAMISVNIAAGGDGGDDDAHSYGGVTTLATVSAVTSIGLSSTTIGLMMRYPTEMLKAGLIFSVILVGMMAVMSIATGSIFAILVGVFFFAVTVYYVKIVWKRIPFAASNLKTALTAVKANLGLGVVAYLNMALAFVWIGLWLTGMAQSYASSNGGIGFLLLVSFYWTYEVIKNTIHVTCAGTVGTWWFVPHEANSCCSKAVSDSFCRATTYSFGSICFGSLLVAIVQALEMMARQARQNEDLQLLYCIIECILSCIRDIIEYLNKWAYVYVGLYGFGYIEAGRNVIQLFQQKGWTVIITDDLADRVLLMMSFAVGVLTGFVGLIAALADPNLLQGIGIEEGATAVAFFISFGVGLMFCSILMSVVGSAINTVIVCFAESPAEFESNHPELSREMRSTWAEAWPELSI